jgi:DNA-directed RNA polymerase sigma subunit (sigma70/sigma32)
MRPLPGPLAGVSSASAMQEKIGGQLGITQERVRQLNVRAM